MLATIVPAEQLIFMVGAVFRTSGVPVHESIKVINLQNTSLKILKIPKEKKLSSYTIYYCLRSFLKIHHVRYKSVKSQSGIRSCRSSVGCEHFGCKRHTGCDENQFGTQRDDENVSTLDFTIVYNKYYVYFKCMVIWTYIVVVGADVLYNVFFK